MKTTKSKEIKSLDLGYKACSNCHHRVKKEELHVTKPEWGENQCEIIKDFQMPVLRGDIV